VDLDVLQTVSRWLHITAAVTAGGGALFMKLALHPAQFNAVLPDKDLAWFDTLDAAVLLTHHPPEWLSAANRRHFQESISYPGRFVVHLTGHLHKPQGEAKALGFSAGRRLVTGPSLFGFERTSDDFDRVHGYGTIQINVGQTSSQGTIRYFPRSARKKQDGFWSIVRDDGFDLNDSDGGTAPENGQFQISQARIASRPKEARMPTKRNRRRSTTGCSRRLTGR